MKILVIDDQPRNVASAKQTLKEHDLTVVDNVKDAELVLNDKFDVILTDLWMPLGDFQTRGMSCVGNENIPAGLLIALKGVKSGTRVVICTDSDYHQDIISNLLGRFIGSDGEICYVEARKHQLSAQWVDGQLIECKPWETKETIKDWSSVLRGEYVAGP